MLYFNYTKFKNLRLLFPRLLNISILCLLSCNGFAQSDTLSNDLNKFNNIVISPIENNILPDEFKPEYFIARRNKVFEKIKPNSIVLIPSNSELLRNGDVNFDFRQNSNFLYLSGFSEPDSVLVLVKDENTTKFILFVRPSNPSDEQWTGKRAGLEGAKTKYLADESYSINQLNLLLPDLIKAHSYLYYDTESDEKFDDLVRKILKELNPEPETKRLSFILDDMRLIKDEYEQDLIAKATKISSEAHIATMLKASQAKYEYELSAVFHYESLRYGARQSYPAIVGSGANSCILHYVENDSVINKADVILVDAGAEYANYASDVTRTYPASGKFSDEQRAIYQLVLTAQKAAIEEVKPDSYFNQVENKVVKILTQGLVDLGIIDPKGASIDELVRKRAYAPFYMHSIGHWSGLDVHDVGSYSRKFLPGMVLTIEPGLYIKEGMEGVDQKWWNIGIRIEDMLLVSDFGNFVLSKDAPKEIEEIESLMQDKTTQ